MTTTESQIELDLIAKLGDLKYTCRPDIRDRTAPHWKPISARSSRRLTASG